MPIEASKSWILCALAALSGCSMQRTPNPQWAEVRPEVPTSVAALLGESSERPKTPASVAMLSADDAVAVEAKLPIRSIERRAETFRNDRDINQIQPVAHVESPVAAAATHSGTLTIEGRTFHVELQETLAESAEAAEADVYRPVPLTESMLSLAAGEVAEFPSLVPIAVDEPTVPPAPAGEPPALTGIDSVPTGLSLCSVETADVVSLNLSSVLAAVGGQHPAVGLAQWRVQEAYARVAQAEVLWLPSIRTGVSVHRHDGNYQASNGDIVDVNRNSLQVGLGVGATGAGTTPRPGLVAEFHLADAIFQPRIARGNAWASGHGSNGVYNRQLLEAALAYLELLEAEQDRQIIDESRQRMAELSRLTRDFAEAGEGLQADADRIQTELILLESRLAEARERCEVASARLAQALSVSADQTIVPLDPIVTPIHLVGPEYGRSMLISAGLSNRPELKEAQALVAAACDEYRRQKYAPFVPSVLLGLSAGGFGGGLGNSLNSVDDRYDFDAIVAWEVRNLGFGERAARRRTSAQFQQAKFEKVRVLDQVAREVSEAYAQLKHRRERIVISEGAIQTAQDSFDRSLVRIRDGEGLPIEVLQSVRALEDAKRTYLRAVTDHNESQFQLQWALGWPVDAGEV